MKKLPSTFIGELGEQLKTVYVGDPRDPEIFFKATSIEEYLGATNPSASASKRMNTIESRIASFNAMKGSKNEKEPVILLGSDKPAYMYASDGVYKILAVKSSKRERATVSYFYNYAALFFVTTTARTDKANELQHFINGEVLPSIAKYGEYIGVRKGGIDLRRCLTDSVKRQIDAKKLDEKAYGTVTDAVYRIRYGLNTYSMRNVMNIDPSDNVREFLPKDELHILGEIEAKVACLVDIGMPLEDIATNPALIKIYRKPL